MNKSNNDSIALYKMKTLDVVLLEMDEFLETCKSRSKVPSITFEMLGRVSTARQLLNDVLEIQYKDKMEDS